MKTALALVVARGSNGVIGKEGDLPWRLSNDLKHFKAVTLGKPVIMGRKTWASLPKALPGRPNLVVTRDTALQAEGASVWTDLEAALAAAHAKAAQLGVAEICVIGGGELYAQTLPRADRLYLTDVDAAPEGDAFFPDFDMAQWQETARTVVPAGPKDDFSFTLRTLDRISGPDAR
ncbi:MAG: hypothetical protein RLZZ157_316 [Pseudomonadota bacterium]|jgi:dihydrofolate reductase